MLRTLGLWGDGDEVWAIEDAFAAISLEVPVDDAPTWITVGDLWASVERLAPQLASSPTCWDDFRQALAKETGVDWAEVERETILIDGRGHNILSRLWTSIRERFGNSA